MLGLVLAILRKVVWLTRLHVCTWTCRYTTRACTQTHTAHTIQLYKSILTVYACILHTLCIYTRITYTHAHARYIYTRTAHKMPHYAVAYRYTYYTHYTYCTHMHNYTQHCTYTHVHIYALYTHTTHKCTHIMHTHTHMHVLTHTCTRTHTANTCLRSEFIIFLNDSIYIATYLFSISIAIMIFYLR